jgi:hypothetical protein
LALPMVNCSKRRRMTRTRRHATRQSDSMMQKATYWWWCEKGLCLFDDSMMAKREVNDRYLPHRLMLLLGLPSFFSIGTFFVTGFFFWRIN